MPATLKLSDGDGTVTFDCAAERPTDGQSRVNFIVQQNGTPVTEMSVNAVLLGKPFFHDQLTLEDKAEAEGGLERCIPQIREQIEGIYRGPASVVTLLKRSRIRVDGTSPDQPIVHLEQAA